MNKRALLKNIALIIALVVAAYLIANYTGTVKSTVMELFHISGSSVKGASTERAQEISQEIGSDFGSQFDVVKEQLLNAKVSDAISGISRLQKIPKDIKSLENFAQEEMQNFTKKK
ncbi:MAG TPA: hypothetical protein VE090_05035 [Methylomirabilota bacterium]|nr:hypothetical protein [Methylomirabilota bacterium]